MNRLLTLGLLTGILIAVAGYSQQSNPPLPPQPKSRTVDYFRASHGYGDGLTEVVDLSQREGFQAVKTLDDLAEFASKVQGAVGFTAHPNFERGTRHAHAVLWYTKLSSTRSSWALHLFDKQEAQKPPGHAPKAAALAAAEAKVSGKMDAAEKLIAAGGKNGVKLEGSFSECEVLALAVLRLGGSFEHQGKFTTGACVGCRTVAPGGTPSACGIGVQKKTHWNCCGSTNEGGYCNFWKLLASQRADK